MKIFRLPILRKALGLELTTAKKPLHAGEIYHLWEALTGTYRMIEISEMYLMNTEDLEVQALLRGLTVAAWTFKINRLEQLLKDEGFTVPPRPTSKLIQGEPGVGQEVKLTDTEVIRNMLVITDFYLQLYARGVMASVEEQVRQLFKDLISDAIIAYKTFLAQAKARNALDAYQPATAKENSLSMAEVATLLDELSSLHLAQVNLETYVASTLDKETLALLQWGLADVTMPQMMQVENLLKKEGFTVSARPEGRLHQYMPGQINKIRVSDTEVVREMLVAFQSYTMLHLHSFSVATREDVLTLFEQFLHKEIEAYERTLKLAQEKHVLQYPPVVSSMRV